jgi:hypothetical protein
LAQTVKAFLKEYKIPEVVRVMKKGVWGYYAFPNCLNRPSTWFASVTTVLGTSLTAREKKMYSTPKNPKILENARTEGIRLHSLVADDLLGRQLHVLDRDKRFWYYWQKIRKEHNITALVVELPLFHKVLGYAGTTDGIINYDNSLAFMDLKTGVYSIRTGWQLAGYAGAFYDWVQNVEPLKLVGIPIHRTGYRADVFEYYHTDTLWSAFLSAFNVWKALYYHPLQKMKWRFRMLHDVPAVSWK